MSGTDAMTGAEVLLTTAEIGVAFAGFASVITVFRQRTDGSWSRPDVIRFQLMIGASLFIVLFALLPFSFDFFGMWLGFGSFDIDALPGSAG